MIRRVALGKSVSGPDSVGRDRSIDRKQKKEFGRINNNYCEFFCKRKMAIINQERKQVRLQ